MIPRQHAKPNCNLSRTRHIACGKPRWIPADAPVPAVLAYAPQDLERIARHWTGSDFSGFFARTVGSGSYLDIRPSDAALGLCMDSFVEEMFISREPGASHTQRARFQAVFGTP